MEKKSSGNGLVIFIVVCLLLGLLGSCNNSDDDYRDLLERGQKKYYSGQTMTKEEYNAVKGFNEWKSKQGEKTYSGWGG